jgi:hypothetical protein
LITTVVFSSATNTFIITGTSLPTGSDVNVAFSNLTCTISSISSTQIVCSLSRSPVCGTWSIEVSDSNGLIPLDPSISPRYFPITVTSVSPNTDLNPAGY